MITIPGVDPNMIVSNIEPAHTTHPGEVLKNEIECRGISQEKFAEQIGVQYTELEKILNCKRPVSIQFAMLLEAALGIDADFWVKLQTRYNILTAKRDKTFSKRLDEIRKIAALL
ncbi:MAG: HigA family addiction module antidote protein [Prevotellaceae bacterium]|jgi:addiction module HigA family antidote|nr:HigA family addiction module antidote protein [Prevotellaceae bacterium]